MKRNGLEYPRSVRELLREKGIHYSFFGESAEALRPPVDRAVASRRAARAFARVARAS